MESIHYYEKWLVLLNKIEKPKIDLSCIHLLTVCSHSDRSHDVFHLFHEGRWTINYWLWSPIYDR